MITQFRIKNDGHYYMTIFPKSIKLYDDAIVRSIILEEDGNISIDVHNATRMSESTSFIFFGGKNLHIGISNIYNFLNHEPSILDVNCNCDLCQGYRHQQKEIIDKFYY